MPHHAMEELEGVLERAEGTVSEQQRPLPHINRRLVISALFVACLLAGVLSCHPKKGTFATSTVGIKNELGLHQNFNGPVTGVTETGDIHIDQSGSYTDNSHIEYGDGTNVINGPVGDHSTIIGGGNHDVFTGNRDDHSQRTTISLHNRDGMLGFGVRQLKSCEGSGNDGHGAGAVGTVCCSNPEGNVACDHGSSGQNVRQVVWKHDWKTATDAEMEDLRRKGVLEHGRIARGNGNIPASEASLEYLKTENIISKDQYNKGRELLRRARED